LLRSLDEARRTADAAVSVAEGFFNSAYGSRDASPALLETGLRHGINVASRISHAEEANKKIDLAVADERLVLRGLSGIDFLLMFIPAIGAALTLARANSTVRIHTESLPRLDTATKDARLKDCIWLNRKHALASQPGVLIEISAAAPAFSRVQLEAWLKGDYAPLAGTTARGLVAGVQKSKGLVGVAIAPAAGQFQIWLALPV
jgi:hypothetical protein